MCCAHGRERKTQRLAATTTTSTDQKGWWGWWSLPPNFGRLEGSCPRTSNQFARQRRWPHLLKYILEAMWVDTAGECRCPASLIFIYHHHLYLVTSITSPSSRVTWRIVKGWGHSVQVHLGCELIYQPDYFQFRENVVVQFEELEKYLNNPTLKVFWFCTSRRNIIKLVHIYCIFLVATSMQR